MMTNTASGQKNYFHTAFTPLKQFLTDSILQRGFYPCGMASIWYIGSLFFYFWNKSYGHFCERTFLEKYYFPPPPIWLRVLMAKFVFVCVCIFVFLVVLCVIVFLFQAYLCIFIIFRLYLLLTAHHLLTSRHFAINLAALR